MFAYQSDKYQERIDDTGAQGWALKRGWKSPQYSMEGDFTK